MLSLFFHSSVSPMAALVPMHAYALWALLERAFTFSPVISKAAAENATKCEWEKRGRENRWRNGFFFLLLMNKYYMITFLFTIFFLLRALSGNGKTDRATARKKKPNWCIINIRDTYISLMDAKCCSRQAVQSHANHINVLVNNEYGSVSISVIFCHQHAEHF